MKFKRASIITKIVVVILLVYAATTMVSLCMRIENAKAEKAALETSIEDKIASNDELAYAIENSDDESVIEDIARNKLGLVLPDEKVFSAE